MIINNSIWNNTRFFSILFTLCFFNSIVSADNSSLLFNEIMVANVDVYPGPAYNFDGWCELYNNSNNDVDISGWYIRDNKEQIDILPETCKE